MKTILALLISGFLSIFSSTGPARDTGTFELLLTSSAEHLAENEFDQAYEDALGAMKFAEKEDSDVKKAECLCSLASIDIAGTRDAQAWERALASESLSRKCGFVEFLAKALIIKAQVCLFADGGPGSNRNLEGLRYLEEAIPLCEAEGMEEYRFEAFFCYAQILVNENRWNKVINQDIYRRAGEYYEKAQELAYQLQDDDALMKVVLGKCRYLRQGGYYKEALSDCNGMLERCGESDNLTRYQIYDMMTNLYAELDSTEQAVNSHRNTVQTMVSYMKQKSDARLHDLEMSYETEIRDHKIRIMGYRTYALVITLLLSATALFWAVRMIRLSKARNRALSVTNSELTRDNAVKEQVISFIAPDMSSPAGDKRNTISELSDHCLFLDNEEQIRSDCNKVLSDYGVSSEVAAYITESMVQRRKRAEAMGISPREIQVIHLCRQGMSSAEIAARLFISVNTVSTHKRNIYSKLDVSNTAEMVKKSLSMGLL